ncbi:PAS domain-containing sensor histidine kinase [Adhaeribacter radiodurans]|uniref:histidine kinase n=1 Tax=Adhaeribacter radiodurans TaxID=2745197 RepID=A0A7L7L888_9BACT|nr:PAS domain-containing protein [Adhaeribacter radiodurans]QMU28765.1 PAS domain-containing protein [Adhaeribacter radiodurans]
MTNTSSALPELSLLNFQSIYASMPGNFLVLYPNAPHYSILAITEDLLQATGRKQEDTIGKSFFTLFPENPTTTAVVDPSPIRILLKQVWQSKQKAQMPIIRYDVLNTKGVLEERYWSVSCKPVLAKDGNVAYFILANNEITNPIQVDQNLGNTATSNVFSAAIEVTEQALTRKGIEESEQQVRAIIASSHHPIGVYLGNELRIEFANQSLMNGLGKGNDIIGKRYKDLLPELANQGIFEKLDHVLATGIPYHTQNQKLELVVDGQLKSFYFNFSFTPLINSAGQVYGIVNTGADITALNEAQQKIEESEQRFRLMADASPTMIWSLAPDASLKYANSFMLGFLGISMEKYKADNWLPYIHPEDQQRSIHTIGEAFEQRQPFRNEHRFLRHDGEYRWLLSQAAPSYYPNGEIYGYVGSSVDITEIKQAEMKLQHYAQELATVNEELRFSHNQVQEANIKLSSINQQLSRMNADMDNFIYTASHDLKAPILNIEGLMEALRSQLSPASLRAEDIQYTLHLIADSVQRFKRTIGHLTEVTKLQKENNLEATSVNLASVISEVQLDLANDIRAAQARVEVEVTNCPTIPFAEKNMRSIVYNLLSNALKYRSPNRQAIIQILCASTDDYQVLTVTDNGLGMDLSGQSKLFTMFKRLHTHVEGSGIGLYMVKKIIENAGGRIEVSSKVDEGSTFQVYFRRDK